MEAGSQKRKIALVVQRYGLEVNGGAEMLARTMAEHLKDRYDIEVLTSRAVDYVTWKDEYTAGEEDINGIKVRRFGVTAPRNPKQFDAFSGKVIGRPHSMEDEERWFDMQGPRVPDLIDYIREHADDYDAFVFMTYLYYTTVKGLPLVKDKAILISTAHDEPPIYLKTFEELFLMPKAMFYLTFEEKKFVERKFGNGHLINNDGYGGSGVEIPEKVDPMRLKNEKGVEHYMLYAGRIDEAKGCKELFDFFRRYKKNNPSDLKLVMIGKPAMPIPKDSDIMALGFVSEQEKYDYMSGADFLIMSSPFESLSIVVLESMTLNRPVLCNGRCDVLKGHCVRSTGGLYYKDYYEFEGCVNYLLQHPDIADGMGRNGHEYVERNFRWDKICDRFEDVVERVCASK
ncbi:MAG: glycosyltransferase family 4 protein [Clostridia bacterium]|nr:glycosyltransferase family 4 protein [Clostridia bacterium]